MNKFLVRAGGNLTSTYADAEKDYDFCDHKEPRTPLMMAAVSDRESFFKYWFLLYLGTEWCFLLLLGEARDRVKKKGYYTMVQYLVWAKRQCPTECAFRTTIVD